MKTSIMAGETRSEAVRLLRRYLDRRPYKGGLLHVALEVGRDGTVYRSSEAKLARIRFHDLRHTHATLALQAGVHPKVVQERLGHSDISITLQTYSHVLPGMQAAAASLVASLVFATEERRRDALARSSAVRRT